MQHNTLYCLTMRAYVVLYRYKEMHWNDRDFNITDNSVGKKKNVTEKKSIKSTTLFPFLCWVAGD